MRRPVLALLALLFIAGAAIATMLADKDPRFALAALLVLLGVLMTTWGARIVIAERARRMRS